MQSKFTKELEKKTIDNLIFVENQIKERHNFKRACEDLILGIEQKKKCVNQKLTELNNFENIPLKFPTIWQFQPGKIKLVSENEFGKFIIKDIPNKQIAKPVKQPTVTRYKGSIVKSHLLNFHATTIVPTGDGNVWLSCYYDNSIRVVNQHGRTVNNVTIDFHIYDFVLTGCGKILATDTKEKGIKEISADGNVKVVAPTRPYAPLGLCLNSIGQIIVGLQGPPHKIRILSYSDSDEESRKIRDVEKDECGKSLFSRYVDRVIQNGNGDYIVLCGCKQVIALDGNWKTRWEYGGKATSGGHHGTKYITGICCDSMSNIIFGDSYNSQVNMLNMNGVFLCVLLRSNNGLDRPRAINVDNRNLLWITSKGGREIVAAKYT